WGIDEFGPWVEFEVPREGQSAVVQRMRWIPPGEFLMGSPEGEPGRWENEGPQHLVTLTCGFWMWDTPCTQALWTAVMSGNPSRFPTPDRPVEQVSWEDCGQFFVRLHAVVAGLAAGLPTEAEWEYACRAGATSATYAGAMEILGLNNAPVLDSIAWYGGNSGMDYELKNGLDAIKWPEKQYEFRLAGTHPVGRKSSNSYGLFDMLGNVWEWCADAWDEYSEGPSADPLPSSDEATPLRVARGGSWGDYARGVRAACRDSSVLSRCLDYLGFRGRVHGCEPSQPAQQAEQRTERAVSRRSGQAEPRADDSPASAGRRAVWVNLHAGGVPSIPTPAGQTVRIVSDVQQLTLRAAPKPFWAAAIGRDRFGLWCEFDLPRPVGMPPAPGRPRARQGVVTQRLRWIPPGQFLMGSPRDEPGRHANEPEPTVTTIHKGFWLFDTPCTQELWETVTGENPSFFKSPTRPVEQVRWYDCVEFGRRLRERIPEIVGELPSVAEWEYACRAGTQTATYAGPLEILGVANAPALDPIAWYAGNAGVEFELQNGVKNNRASVKQYNYNVAGTHPVALKLPNAWGLYDTLGNVWEWCSDAWSEPAERRAAALHDETQSAPLRVVRGGSWDGDARYVQAASSTFFKPSRRLYYLGFRCRVQECEPSQPGSERADRSEQAAAPSVAEQEGAAGAASADRHAGHSTNG
ncbi:MAG: formylglycine-generating enzyme family protein, partial [Planctomycetota bacterium]|nr:formylglycine-generating enzyme family protein [Planctomycetota bacterium]